MNKKILPMLLLAASMHASEEHKNIQEIDKSLRSGSSVCASFPGGLMLLGRRTTTLNATGTIQEEVIDLSHLNLINKVYNVSLTIEDSTDQFSKKNFVVAWIKSGSMNERGFTIRYFRTGNDDLYFKVRYQVLAS